MQISRLITTQATVPTISLNALLDYQGIENIALRTMVSDPASGERIDGKRIAVLAADGVEEIEVTIPLHVLRARGATVEVLAPSIGPSLAKLGLTSPAQRATHIVTVRFMENAGWLPFDRSIETAEASAYDAVYVPGGAWSPDILRSNEHAIAFLRAAAKADKVIASICHGPLVLADAGLLADRHATSYWSVSKDLINAGARWKDAAVVRDGRLITSRYPLDLPEFIASLIDALKA
jgi:protease I